MHLDDFVMILQIWESGLGGFWFQIRFWAFLLPLVPPRWSPEAPGRLLKILMFSFFFLLFWAGPRGAAPEPPPEPPRSPLE